MSRIQAKSKEVEEVLKPKKIFTLRLSKQELVHLRDLFGIMLPPDMKTTVSQAIASSQGRHMAESKLWNKIAGLCEESNIPMGDEAPDFVVTISAPPQLGVFEMKAEGLVQVINPSEIFLAERQPGLQYQRSLPLDRTKVPPKFCRR